MTYTSKAHRHHIQQHLVDLFICHGQCSLKFSTQIKLFAFIGRIMGSQLTKCFGSASGEHLSCILGDDDILFRKMTLSGMYRMGLKRNLGHASGLATSRILEADVGRGAVYRCERLFAASLLATCRTWYADQGDNVRKFLEYWLGQQGGMVRV